ncbi:MAG: response regulator [Spirochaetes bacterium]|nr:response regulator [Spirochaetota bacterium]
MAKKASIGDRGDGTFFKVLIIDDSVFVVKQLSQILQSEKFDVIDSADDGEMGYEKYKKHFPDIDLVTLDITMPKMDGIATLEKIMEFDKNAKVIIISALGKENLVKKALIIGAKNYIVKPLDRTKVLKRIESILDGEKNES